MASTQPKTGWPQIRAMEVARSVERGSRRGGKAGVRIRDQKQRFCIHPAMEAFADEQPWLVLLVRSGHAPVRHSCARGWAKA
jgi:hypothetical protein